MAPMRGRSKRARVESGLDGGDRISDLPDEVLHRVLWFLPTHEAVQTSLLSSRWLELWKSTRCLSIVGFSWSPCFRSTAGGGSSAVVDKLSKFVNHLLLSRNQGPLDECRFSLHGFEDLDGAQVDMWFRYVLENVWQLRVLLIHLGTSVRVKLAGKPLVSKHLVRLELSEANFKGRFLDFSCCTVLEYLKMHACVIGVDKIFSQSLKHLVITRCKFNSASRTEISVNSLLSLELDYCEGQTPLLQTMPSLERSFVNLGWFYEDHYRDGICGECYGSCENYNDNRSDDDNCSENNSGDNDYCSENNSGDHFNCSENNSGDNGNCSQNNSGDNANCSENNSSDNDNSSDNGNCSIEDNYNTICRLCVNCRDNDNISGTCLLLGGLSSATYLQLTPPNCMFIIRRDLRWCPTFSNLRTLILDDYSLDYGFHALLFFLPHTPVLQKLTLNLCKIRGLDTMDISSYLKKTVVLRHLRIVEVKCPKNAVEEVCNLWKILVTWGRDIEQFNIQRSYN